MNLDLIYFQIICIYVHRFNFVNIVLMEEVLDKMHSRPGTKRGSGNLQRTLFQNVSIAAPSVLGEAGLLWGMENGMIFDLIFDNIHLMGTQIKYLLINK